jgi:biotin synthase
MVQETSISKLSREEIISLLQTEDSDKTKQIFALADQIRLRYVGDEVHLRALIEFSNYCKRNCSYCGIRRGNSKLQRYRMAPDEIIDTAIQAGNLGYRTIVLQSGEDPWYKTDMLCHIIGSIKENVDVAITLCIGELPRTDYEKLRQAGADRYLLKFETSDTQLYERLHPEMDMTLENRLLCLTYLKELGYQVGSGNMVGLPGQSVESLADDVLLLEELEVEMAGIGPFIPHPDTPLSDFPAGRLDMVLKVLALTRIVTRITHLPATTAVGSIHPQGRQKALLCGANVIMPNVTPLKYRQYYEIYPNRICIKEEPADCYSCVKNIVMSLGRKISTDFGHGLRQQYV